MKFFSRQDINESMTTEFIFRRLYSINLARHGNSVRTVGFTELTKPLSSRGREQAESIRKQLSGSMFDFVGASPLPRAQEMALIATSECETVRAVTTMHSLNLSLSESNPLNIMFTELGNRPLGDYLNHRLGEWLRLWANTALIEIFQKISEIPVHPGDILEKNVFIAGHAVCQPAIAWAIGNIFHTCGSTDQSVEWGQEVKSKMSDLSLGEAEVITLSPGTGLGMLRP